ncbi:hypothetical protein [Heyndrickxia vini]|uniref:Uncharacterized protein n=1 Tax=Heyndrickxia vini TaxID=1476025 RepID=A0ABX7DW14_9BACI|nr:hypothetical protein [Heyndrickxia vini]QQZ07689.1 hypothetical protein I5776_11330 [Heyndrickxia vini]
MDQPSAPKEDTSSQSPCRNNPAPIGTTNAYRQGKTRTCQGKEGNEYIQPIPNDLKPSALKYK